MSIPAQAALNAFLTLSGSRQGNIRGSVTQKGREGKIMVIAADHTFYSPVDQMSGQISGRRVHMPLVITKEVDRSSPLLRMALANNEIMKDFRLEFWEPSPTGMEKQYFTIQLINAAISSIKFVMPNTRDPETMRLKEYEEIQFTYQRIIWTYEDGGIRAEDSQVLSR